MSVDAIPCAVQEEAHNGQLMMVISNEPSFLGNLKGITSVEYGFGLDM